MEQHNIFHNEVKAIGPHLTKDGGKVGVGGGGDWERRGSYLHPTLTRVLGSVLRSRTANCRPSIRNCW